MCILSPFSSFFPSNIVQQIVLAMLVELLYNFQSKMHEKIILYYAYIQLHSSLYAERDDKNWYFLLSVYLTGKW